MAGKLLSGSIDLLSMCNSGSVRSFWNFWLMQWVASKRYRRVLKFIYFDTPASHYKHTYTFTTSHYLTTLHYLTSIYFLGLAPTIAQQTVSL